jgi:ParB-like chromosome segregation protein Spo0J
MARSESIEKWLDSHGATYRFDAINIEQVDKVASHRNQARVSAPINEDTVVLYGAAMESGDEFPPLVVYQRRDGKLVVIDGNHRVSAMDLAGLESTDAYIVSDINETQRLLLTFEANTKHGLPTSMEERLRQAVNLVELGASQTSAARNLGLPVPRVQTAVTQFRTDKRLAQLGVDRWDRIPSTARRRLWNLRNDGVFKAAATLAVEANMSGTDLDDLIRRVNLASRGDEKKQLAVIDTERKVRTEDIRVSGGGRVGWSRAALGLNSILSRMVRLDVEALKNDSIGEDQRKRLKMRTLEASKKLQSVADALSK